MRSLQPSSATLPSSSVLPASPSLRTTRALSSRTLSQSRHALLASPPSASAGGGRGLPASPGPSSPATLPGTFPSTSASSTPVSRPSYTVSLFDAMKFNGPGPEVINGRLAMVGLLAGGYHEMQTGDMMLWQVQHVSLGTCLALAVGIIYASLVPMTKGVKQEAFGPFSPRAELTNGRAAMLGFAVLCALEASAGVPFF